MSKVLVTGASGFMGSHMADELTSRGHDVTLFDKVPSPYATSKQKMIVGDISDFEAVNNITRGMDYIFHFAALSDINECAAKPREAAITNIMGTVDMLEACRINDVKRFIFASSAYVFSKAGSFYRSCKQACENYIADYHEQYGLNYVILRFGSLYGSRSNEKNGLFRIIKALLYDNEFTFDGTGDEIRELINIRDAVKITADCLDYRFMNSKLLVTGVERMKMKNIIDMVKEIIGRDTKVTYSEKTQPNHYKITPYNFNYDHCHKIVNNPYIDIGQGIMQVIQEIAYEK